MSKNKGDGFKVWGPTYGYDHKEGARVFAVSYTGNDDKDRKNLLEGIASAENKYATKITIMGVGSSVQGPMRELAKKYMSPSWTVPPNQIHYGFPAGEITKLPEAESEAQDIKKPASKAGKPARKQQAKSRKAKAEPQARNSDTILIQADLWEALKKLGG